jgi:hypothetical protein
VKFQPDWDGLRAGDTLLYGGWAIEDIIVWLKTFSFATHIEVFVGGGQSMASRPGTGCRLYPLRKQGIRYVLRPTGPLDLENGMANFHANMEGLPYGVSDLTQFYPALAWCLRHVGFKVKGIICSEAGDKFYQGCGFSCFNTNYPAGLVVPRDYLVVGGCYFELVWSYKGPGFEQLHR